MDSSAIDVSGVVPEASGVLRAAAEVYLRHTGPWFLGLLAHGSAVKGGFVPNCSDVDLQLFLEDAAFDATGQLPLETCLAIQRELAAIDPPPFRYVQCRPLRCKLPPGWGPVPGAYHVVAGRLPVPEATAEELIAASNATLASGQRGGFQPNNLLELSLERLALQVRWLVTAVWPALYSALTLASGDPLAVWRLPKRDAIALVPAATPLGAAVRAFYEALLRYYPACASVDAALDVIRHGVATLDAAGAWGHA